MEQFFDHNGIFVHFSMFLNYLNSHADDDQKKYWNAQARQGNYIAAYAQTELGHGSNVRGLETTATFVQETQEWEIHSPTLTSLKWWPTGMYACTHALVFAQLIIENENKGLHAFMVQLRKSDGNLMPGVELGEVGPKLNFSSSNIGYCRFTNVRVPKDWLFSKYSKVTTDGKYVPVPKKLNKFRYISMMLSRNAIVRIAYDMCARAATIAIRYSAVRKQGFKSGSDTPGDEHFIIDYQMQRSRTFGALALAYCLLWSGRYINSNIKRLIMSVNEGDLSAADDLPELHATLSGLKAVSTVSAHHAIEECRKCCGGQGFLMSSGIAKLSPDFTEWVTVEGEQVILSLQCARFLIKAVHSTQENVTLTKTVAYIGDKSSNHVPVHEVTTTRGILQLLKNRSKNLSWRLTSLFDAEMKKVGGDFDTAMNNVAMTAVKASNAHVQAFMFENNFLAIQEYFNEMPPIKLVMERLLRLYGLQTISENAGDFFGIEGFSSEAFSTVEMAISTLLNEIRPDAVPLVDSFGFLDSQLQSTLGRYDGNVYEAIYDEAANKNPLNNSKEGKGKMIGWDIYSKVLNLDFLNETEKKQYQARGGNVDNNNTNNNFAASRL